MATFKLQSAMEYLMTYSWAILIIAVVLGALFGLGFFNSANLAPKVTAGSCQVYRPYGPGTTTEINTEGTCNNELPQYVAQFTPLTAGGYSGGVSTPDTSINTGNALTNTVTFWMLYKGGTTGTAVALSSNTAIGVTSSCLGFQQGSTTYGITVTPYINIWVYVTAVIKNTQISSTGFGTTGDLLYINGVLQSAATGTCTSATGILQASPNVYIGYNSVSQTFNGLLANVQIYNNTLGANDIYAQYSVGLGGVPIALNNMAGWWQMNGNANDYSGNLNNGVPTNVIYTSSWTSAYTAP